MSEWQKVRIHFTDADGSGVSAVMWKESPDAQFGSVAPDDSNCWIGWNLAHGVKVEPIRELPTGVGAVIRVNKPQFSDARDLYTHVGGGWWTNLEGDDVSATAEQNGFDKKEWPWEILSEGIQL